MSGLSKVYRTENGLIPLVKFVFRRCHMVEYQCHALCFDLRTSLLLSGRFDKMHMHDDELHP